MVPFACFLGFEPKKCPNAWHTKCLCSKGAALEASSLGRQGQKAWAGGRSPWEHGAGRGGIRDLRREQMQVEGGWSDAPRARLHVRDPVPITPCGCAWGHLCPHSAVLRKGLNEQRGWLQPRAVRGQKVQTPVRPSGLSTRFSPRRAPMCRWGRAHGLTPGHLSQHGPGAGPGRHRFAVLEHSGPELQAEAAVVPKPSPGHTVLPGHTDLGPVAKLQPLPDQQPFDQQLPVPQSPLLPLLQRRTENRRR